MARESWSTSTFEVLTNSGKRWVIDMSSSKRSEAMDYAAKILTGGKCGGVRVTEQRDSWSTERVVFEKLNSAPHKPLKINPTTEVTFCKNIDAYYALPARLTMARIIRAYLDQNNLTMLELLFNFGHLRTLDRMETFYPSAIQHGAQLQAKLTGQSKMERLDKLQTVFNSVLKRARNNDVSAHDAAGLSAHGLEQAIAQIEAREAPKQVQRTIYAMLAAHIEGGGWREKFKRALDLAEQASAERCVELADELLAEILDGIVAIDELFGGFSTAIDAWKTYVLIISGRFDKVPRHMSPDIARLNKLFSTHTLKATRTVLMKRISKGLGGTQALSNNGREDDRSAFIGLVRDLVEPTGISGGPQMVESVVLRAKTLLGEDGEDLPIETAIRQALYLMPSQAARLGVLLDLSSSHLGQKHDGTIRQQLFHLLNELRSIYDLFPQDVNDAQRLHGIDALRDRLGMSVLGEDLKNTLSESLIKMANNEDVVGSDLALDTKSEDQAPLRAVPKNGELDLAQGGVLFEEGEQGKEAYLIVDGVIEISRTHNGKTQHLAMLSKGEILGEMSLIDNQPRMASAKAVVATKLMCISEKNLHERLAKLAQNDQVLHFLLKTVVRRLRGLARNTE
ncbi:MAG: cyclic nucleotide-binding domain-containing protein [Magnetovibrio sp.]|nr:cyclic nucleotide-binding domain-containing protein [Magnetovibrio sp.]